MSVRIAKPKEVEGLFDNLKAPEFSTSIGLIIYSLGKHSSYEIDSNRKFRSKYSEDFSQKEPEELNHINIDTNEQTQQTEKEKVVTILDKKKEEASLMAKLNMWFKNLF
jgi:cell division protein FtsA